MDTNRQFKFGAILALALLLTGMSLFPASGSKGRDQQFYSNGIDRKYMWTTSALSPDHKTQARIEVARAIGTPEGSNSCLYLDSRAVYPTAHPKDCNPGPRDIYDGVHAFLTPPEWSPDSRKVAIVVRIFDWEYTDPFGKYFDGSLTNDRYFLVIASLDQPSAGYSLKSTVSNPPSLKWVDNTRLTLDGQVFDLAAQPPTPIP
jgi:hypothetical protein